MITNKPVEYVQCLYLYDIYTKEVLGAEWCGGGEIEEGQLVSYPVGIGENNLAIVVRIFTENKDNLEDCPNAICAYRIEETQRRDLMCVYVQTPDYDYHLCTIQEGTDIHIEDNVIAKYGNEEIYGEVSHIVYIDESMFQKYNFTLYKAEKCKNQNRRPTKDLIAYKLVETDNSTYDLTFEDIHNRIVVYSYSNETYETEVYDMFVKTDNPTLTYEENFDENIKRYIKETFDIDIDEIEMN